MDVAVYVGRIVTKGGDLFLIHAFSSYFLSLFFWLFLLPRKHISSANVFICWFSEQVHVQASETPKAGKQITTFKLGNNHRRLGEVASWLAYFDLATGGFNVQFASLSVCSLVSRSYSWIFGHSLAVLE